MNRILKSEIEKHLSKIIDMSIGKDILSAGIVSNISIKDRNIQITLEVESHKARAYEKIRQETEKRVQNLPEINNCTVILTSHQNKKELQTKDIEDQNDHQIKTRTYESKVNSFIAVASGKGGVGKSTTATNLAVSLGLEGLEVGLLDADVYGPSQPRMLGVSGRPKALAGDMVAPMRNFGISMMSMGLLVPDETAMIWRGPMVQSALTQMLNNVVWKHLDVMIVDLPPGTGDIQISLAQQVNLSGVVIVSTPQDIALLDVSKAISMFEKSKVKISGMIQNMSFWQCSDCGKIDHLFGNGGVEKEALKRGIPLLGEIPLSSELREASDRGTPIVISQPNSHNSLEYRKIAGKLIKIHNLNKNYG